jgi:PmbA protein
MQPTGNSGGTHNLRVTSGTRNFEQMLELLDTGLLVTEVMGSGVNMLTGDYSRGAAGFWVEKGQIAYPVDGITIAGQLQNMYANIVAVGNDAIKHRAIACPSILIEQLTIGGSSSSR